MRTHAPSAIRAVLAALFVTTLVSAADKPAAMGNVTTIGRHGDTFDLRTSGGAIVQIQILKSDLFRIWAAPKDSLVGEGSHAAPIVLPQRLEPVGAAFDTTGESPVISTSLFALVIHRTPLMFALYRPDRKTVIWQELKPLVMGEAESYQTLSSSADEQFYGGGQQNGSYEFKGKVMEIAYSNGWEEGDRPNPAPFYISSKGYGVLRNTWADGRYDFWSTDYLTTMHKENRFDAYYMVGQSINHVLDEYTQLTGRAGLLPRWGYEFGDADCYNDRDNVDKPGTVPPGWSDGPTGTTPDVVASVAAKYREFDMPGGWILPNDGYGCGYTDLPGVVESLKKYGFHTGLWTESGIDKIAWEVGKAGTRVQKLDVAWTGKGYQFALDANMEASKGILDNSDSRPFVWTVMGWAGIQRYAVTWTGDQSGSWDYIRWHIPTLIGSGLSGMIYATGDVDGIYGGGPETYMRDLQWKCFTPVLMGMSGWSKNERKHPWWFEEPYRSINRDYLKLKMRLMPYMYTLAHEAELTGAPIVRGLMWDYPDDPHANDGTAKYQFLLGKDLLVAPVYRSQAASKGWRDNVYLPQGDWIDYWDGTVTRVGANGLTFDYPVTLEKLPLFVRAGSILPMYPAALYDGEVPKDLLTLDIYPHGHSEYTLYEDDGHTRAYRNGAFSQQTFRVNHDSAKGTVAINLEPATGSFQGMCEKRLFVLQVHTAALPKSVTVDGNQLAGLKDSTQFSKSAHGWYYVTNDRHGVLYIKTDTLSVRAPHTVVALVGAESKELGKAQYPKKPKSDGTVSSDNLLVVNRPAEEPGFPLENAFDGNPATWFRTVRDQSVSYGPHEFVLSLKDRRVIDGFTITPRNDKYWKYGQTYKYELYIGENNGEWGEPVIRDTLAQLESTQTVHFAATAGRVVRFRVLTTHDMEIDSTAPKPGEGSVDPLAVTAVKPVTISEFHLLEHQVAGSTRVVKFLSAMIPTMIESGPVDFDPHGLAHAGSGFSLNGLNPGVCYTVKGNSRIDFDLKEDWQSFRVEAGIDDQSTGQGPVRFQIYGNDRLLYDSGPVKTGPVAKLEVDIRGIRRLSLRTVDSSGKSMAHWAEGTLIGLSGDRAAK
ncbi:MAG: TIM-barrel domain-containing protein [Candidatus Zixiibacteriota bacterium]